MTTSPGVQTRPAVRRLAGVVAACGIIATTALWAGSAAASGDTLDECVRKKVAAGTERAKAMTECLQNDNNTPATTLSPISPTVSSSDDEGASTTTLLLVGALGAIIGAGAVLLLRKRPEPQAMAAPPAAPAPMMAPPGFGASAPAAAAAATDRSRPLVVALVDLSDRVNSGALRAEIVATLGQAGVQALEPAQGTAFDATRMRGVGSAPAPDAGWVGTVAATERVGFMDGGTVIRLPEVIVYTAGS